MYNFSNAKTWETLVSIMVGATIMVIAIGGIVLILMQSSSIEEDYDTKSTISLLRSNAENIVQKIDTSLLNEGESFYLYDNPVSRTYSILTGITNEPFRYINRHGEQVTDPSNYTDTVFVRTLNLEKNDTSFVTVQTLSSGSIREWIRK